MRGLIYILVALAALAGVAVWVFSERDVVLRFSEDDLRKQLEARLPYEKRYLFIFDVRLEEPRIDLIEGADRIAGGVDIALKAGLGGQAITLNGGADLSGGVRYDAGARALFMTDPVVERLRLPGLPEAYEGEARRAVSLALAEFYETRPIYVLDADTASKAAARLLLKDVAVHNEKLEVTLGLDPAKTEKDRP